MRNNPAGESYIASLGVQTRDANGNLRDTVDLVNDLGRELVKKPQWLSKQYGETLGINERHLLGMRDEAYYREFDKSRKAFKDSGVDRASDQAHGAMKWWRRPDRRCRRQSLARSARGLLEPAPASVPGFA
ncbi:hypothetical protein ACTMU2_29320 [Cupriavidus basilensis]